MEIKEPIRKRRKKKDIEKGTGGLQCEYCMATLSKKQTLESHIEKFHPKKDPSLNEILEKGNFKDNLIHSTLVDDTEPLFGNQTDLFQTPFQSSFDLRWAKSNDEKQAMLNMNQEGMQLLNEICLNLDA